MLSIRKLTASFGRLDHQTLELHKGLNVISGGNETGKTTWTEFILAMFYGVDLKERRQGDRLPLRTQYQPWNGKPMSGRMELTVDDRVLVLERSSHRAPFRDLTVYDASGNPAPDLFASNCGEALLGVEAEVYRSSGCLRQHRAVVSADPDLEKRLSGLVTTGSEEASFTELDKRLKKLMNEIRYNQSGELPRVRTSIRDAEDALQRCDSLLRQKTELERRITQAEAREAELSEIAEGLVRLEQSQIQQAIGESRAALEQAEADMQAWEAVCAELPPAEVLEALRRDLREIRAMAQTAALDTALDQQAIPTPPDDPAFYQFSAEQAAEKARQDAEFVTEHLEQQRFSPARFLRLLPGLLLLIAGLGLVLSEALPHGWRIFALVLAGAGAVLLLLAVLNLIRRKSAIETDKQAARNLLTWYEAHSAQEIREKASAYGKAWASYQQAQEGFTRSMEERSARAAALSEQTSNLLGRMQAYVPECKTLDQTEAYLREAAFSTASLAAAQRQSVTRRAALERLQSRTVSDPGTGTDLDRFRQYDPAEIRSGLARCREELRSLRSEADRISGALEELGDPYVLNARIESLSAREEALSARYEALLLARTALADADEELRSRFSPLLCRRAGEIFSMLTEGRYDRITLDREFRVRIHPTGSTVDHPLSCFSGGTVDQLYLALRLAICDLLLPGAPIILDDALVYFDDQRAELALRTLMELAKNRQILLFTCQSREKRLLEKIKAEH